MKNTIFHAVLGTYYGCNVDGFSTFVTPNPHWSRSTSWSFWWVLWMFDFLQEIPHSHTERGSFHLKPRFHRARCLVSGIFQCQYQRVAPMEDLCYEGFGNFGFDSENTPILCRKCAAEFVERIDQLAEKNPTRVNTCKQVVAPPKFRLFFWAAVDRPRGKGPQKGMNGLQVERNVGHVA